ncbi:MAG: heavy-metal-associated domain-containing protein [Thermodesulfovibrionales bacterium]|nr:heavy-metal-associated domain-containing protein [Thermodesulfovibrionales bacterium]
MADATINIEGMTCQHCVGRVKQALEALDGVQGFEVEIGSAKVSFDSSATSKDEIAAAVAKSGYTVVG